MHANERESAILELISLSGFVSFQEIDRKIDASPATLRRDLDRLAAAGDLERVRGGAKLIHHPGSASGQSGSNVYLRGVPFHENINLYREQKEAIGRAAARLCVAGEGVMIDGGSTTLQMCPHIESLGLQVLTNSLHIVGALLPQASTRVLVPSGTVFREQNIILSAAGEDSMPQFHAPKLFMGAAGIGMRGLMQADTVLVAAERRLIEMADELIALVDSSKFANASGIVVCELDQIDVLITDAGISADQKAIIEDAGIRLIIS